MCDYFQEENREILYKLCCFHGILKERQNYESLGWRNSYSFSDSDLDNAIVQYQARDGVCIDGARRGSI